MVTQYIIVVVLAERNELVLLIIGLWISYFRFAVAIILYGISKISFKCDLSLNLRSTVCVERLAVNLEYNIFLANRSSQKYKLNIGQKVL